MGDKVNDKSWDIGFHREMGDESNPTNAIVIGGPSFSLHFIDPLNAGTDFNVSATTVPTIFIHGSATCPTEYVKIYTDETDGHFDVAGGNAVIGVPTSGDVTIQVNSTDEYVFDAAGVDFKSNTLGSLGTTSILGQLNMGSQKISGAGDITLVTTKTIEGVALTLRGTGLTIDGGGTAIKFATASYAAIGTGTVATGVVGPAAVGSVSIKAWLLVKADAAGTSLGYIPLFNA